MKLHFLENRKRDGYADFGMIWEQGSVKEETGFLLTVDGEPKPVQTKVSAYWPDGTVKWTTHCANFPKETNEIVLEAAEADKENKEPYIPIREKEDCYQIDTGQICAEIPKSGECVLRNVQMGKTLMLQSAKLVLEMEATYMEEDIEVRRRRPFIGMIDSVELEETGSLKSVFKLTGSHKRVRTGEDMVPFSLRLTFYAGEEKIHVMHTFLYDGDEKEDFLAGIGLQLFFPIKGALYNRHVKIGGDYGYLHEASQLVTSWRPHIDSSIYVNQIKGETLALDESSSPSVVEALKDITVWSNYHIYQNSADSYEIQKRTGKEECCYIRALGGKRAKGIAACSGEEGGIALGLRHFWEKYPSSLWIDGLDKDEVMMTAWIWSPESRAMDFRHYDTEGHASAYYEGFDEVGAMPYGIANTNELLILPFAGNIPRDEELDDWALGLHKPPVLIADPEYYHRQKAFGEWSLPNRDTLVKSRLEDELDKAITFYKKEIDVRGWYGLYDYGDVMHTYDRVRHCWKYDMGGYAWQNTELVPTLWLWYAFLRSGRSDIYEMAEAMSRHTSDVDTYHIGAYKGLGSRHNVRHWGCSCKEPRIAMAGHHRIYYYLSGDPRIADVFDDVKDADFATLELDPLRFFYEKKEMHCPTHARSGPDWSSYTSNWMTEWERHQDIRYRDKILVGLQDIKEAPLKLASGSDFEYDPETGHLHYIGENAAGGSHLMICMGAPQTWFELMELLKEEEWKKMLADLGVLYFDEPEIRAKKTKGLKGAHGFSYPYMAAAVGAYAARYYQDEELGKKVWKSFREEIEQECDKEGYISHMIENYVNQKCYEEIPWITTNITAQWCLNIIMCLEIAKDYLPEEL